MRAKVYKLIRNLPVFGAVFRIVNAYAYKGKGEFNLHIAPMHMWWDRVFRKMSYIFIFVGLLFLVRWESLSSLNWQPADAIFSVFPSVLGFGIGVFALMFVMPSNFMRFLIEKRDVLKFGPEIVPVDMGYPLIVFALVIACAAINKMFPCQFLTFISTWAFFYGLSMSFELISFLFNTSYYIQRVNSNEKK